MSRRRTRQLGWDAVGIAVFVVMVFPVFWMITTAFKPNQQIVSLTPTWLPIPATLSHFRDAMDLPYFWDDVKNSLIIVSATVAISIVVAFLAAIALARYRFSGRFLFVLLVIGIQMLPQAGLIIPLYVVLARYHQVNVLSGVVITYLTFVLPFCVWTLRGFLLGIPEGPRGSGDGRRLDARRRLPEDPAAADGAGPRRHVGVRVHHDLERVHLRARAAERPGEADAHRLALVHHGHEPAYATTAR